MSSNQLNLPQLTVHISKYPPSSESTIVLSFFILWPYQYVIFIYCGNGIWRENQQARECKRWKLVIKWELTFTNNSFDLLDYTKHPVGFWRQHSFAFLKMLFTKWKFRLDFAEYFDRRILFSVSIFLLLSRGPVSDVAARKGHWEKSPLMDRTDRRFLSDPFMSRTQWEMRYLVVVVESAPIGKKSEWKSWRTQSHKNVLMVWVIQN